MRVIAHHEIKVSIDLKSASYDSEQYDDTFEITVKDRYNSRANGRTMVVDRMSMSFGRYGKTDRVSLGGRLVKNDGDLFATRYTCDLAIDDIPEKFQVEFRKAFVETNVPLEVTL